MTTPRWTRVLDVSELSVDRPRTIKTGGKQIVLFRLADGAAGAGEEKNDPAAAGDAASIQAIDNRCPHEGYPLSTGMLKDGILTCEWHNWKFRLCDGECILGGENVRHYPLQVRDDGGIWLDLTDPEAHERFPSLYKSLEKAFFENDWGQASRTVERLLTGGEKPNSIIGFGCDWAARHAPYGFDHGLAAAADIAALIAADGDAGALLLETLNLMVEPNLRRPARTLGEPKKGDRELAMGKDWPAVEDELRRRLEIEDLEGSEGLVRAAVQAGAGPREVFRWLTHAATDHFLGYGHSHIYCVKAEELLEAIGWDHAHPVLTSLVSNIVYDTREDRLPYMRDYNKKVAPYLSRLGEWASTEPLADAPLELDEIIDAVVDGDLGDALEAVADALDRRVAPDRIALALALAAAHRLMRFDPRLEHDDDISEGWLHITHALTHADAVRESLKRRPSAEALRGLFHSARFIQHMTPCDLEDPEDWPAVVGRAPESEAGDGGLAAALRARDPGLAMAAVRRGDLAAVEDALRRTAIDDRATMPIFVVHHIKMTLAAIRLTRAAMAEPELRDHGDRDLATVATVRFLAHSLQERRIARRASVARNFVREGKMQIKLLGY